MISHDTALFGKLTYSASHQTVEIHRPASHQTPVYNELLAQPATRQWRFIVQQATKRPSITNYLLSQPPDSGDSSFSKSTNCRLQQNNSFSQPRNERTRQLQIPVLRDWKVHINAYIGHTKVGRILPYSHKAIAWGCWSRGKLVA